MTDTLAALILFFVAVLWTRMWVRRAKERRIASRRRVEQPNSHYSSEGVRQQEDRERWGRIDLRRLHPLNRDEVLRLLELADADGVGVLSSRDRLFLDNMALPRSRR